MFQIVSKWCLFYFNINFFWLKFKFHWISLNTKSSWKRNYLLAVTFPLQYLFWKLLIKQTPEGRVYKQSLRTKKKIVYPLPTDHTNIKESFPDGCWLAPAAVWFRFSNEIEKPPSHSAGKQGGNSFLIGCEWNWSTYLYLKHANLIWLCSTLQKKEYKIYFLSSGHHLNLIF